jgi:hypothetical protein
MARRPLIADVVASLQQPSPAAEAEQVIRRTDGDNVEARSVSRTIRTVEDLLSHIEADLERYEVAASEATKWEGMTADRETGRPVVTELFRVFVRLKPKPGPGVRECVEAMIASASKGVRVHGSRTANKPSRKGTWAVLVVADTHFGKYCWEKTTGEADYDLEIAKKVPSWRRVCKSMLRNDWWCKGLGLTQPKSEAYGRYLKMKKEREAA